MRLGLDAAGGVQAALDYLEREQLADGSWFGRWGVNYIYGTALVLRGLEAIGIDLHEPCVQQGAEWLRMVQNADGGWGETVGSYDDPTLRGDRSAIGGDVDGLQQITSGAIRSGRLASDTCRGRHVAPKDSTGYLMDHSSIVYLLDRNGRFVTHFTHEAKAEAIAAGVERLL